VSRRSLTLLPWRFNCGLRVQGRIEFVACVSFKQSGEPRPCLLFKENQAQKPIGFPLRQGVKKTASWIVEGRQSSFSRERRFLRYWKRQLEPCLQLQVGEAAHDRPRFMDGTESRRPRGCRSTLFSKCFAKSRMIRHANSAPHPGRIFDRCTARHGFKTTGTTLTERIHEKRGLLAA